MFISRLDDGTTRVARRHLRWSRRAAQLQFQLRTARRGSHPIPATQRRGRTFATHAHAAQFRRRRDLQFRVRRAHPLRPRDASTAPTASNACRFPDAPDPRFPGRSKMAARSSRGCGPKVRPSPRWPPSSCSSPMPARPSWSNWNQARWPTARMLARGQLPGPRRAGHSRLPDRSPGARRPGLARCGLSRC